MRKPHNNNDISPTPPFTAFPPPYKYTLTCSSPHSQNFFATPVPPPFPASAPKQDLSAADGSSVPMV